jgi:hypothetical protein
MAVGEGLPIAVMYFYEGNAEPDVDKEIAAFLSITGQAAVAFFGWLLCDSIKNDCGAW